MNTNHNKSIQQAKSDTKGVMQVVQEEKVLQKTIKSVKSMNNNEKQDLYTVLGLLGITVIMLVSALAIAL